MAPPVQDGEDVPMDHGEDMEAYIENSGEFLKYNISVDLPTFSDEEYDAHLRSEDWSREETDYLFEVVRDYSYRWAVIWDRYDYQPADKSHLTQETVNGNDASQALAALPFAPPKTRTVEDLKARFYDISAKLMKLRIPEMQMDADQYALYETLSKFDPSLERSRRRNSCSRNCRGSIWLLIG
jgi:DNA methyltransferase 1-associated protein 1